MQIKRNLNFVLNLWWCLCFIQCLCCKNWYLLFNMHDDDCEINVYTDKYASVLFITRTAYKCIGTGYIVQENNICVLVHLIIKPWYHQLHNIKYSLIFSSYLLLYLFLLSLVPFMLFTLCSSFVILPPSPWHSTIMYLLCFLFLSSSHTPHHMPLTPHRWSLQIDGLSLNKVNYFCFERFPKLHIFQWLIFLVSIVIIHTTFLIQSVYYVHYCSIIMVIFKCYLSGELIALSLKKHNNGVNIELGKTNRLKALCMMQIKKWNKQTMCK